MSTPSLAVFFCCTQSADDDGFALSDTAADAMQEREAREKKREGKCVKKRVKKYLPNNKN